MKATRSAAYSLGIEAAKSGRAYEENPFREDVAAQFDWSDGWEDATKESEVRQNRADQAETLDQYMDAVTS